MTKRDTIPPGDRCPTCRGHGWVQLTHDPDTDIDCPTCHGTGRNPPWT